MRFYFEFLVLTVYGLANSYASVVACEVWKLKILRYPNTYVTSSTQTLDMAKDSFIAAPYVR